MVPLLKLHELQVEVDNPVGKQADNCQLRVLGLPGYYQCGLSADRTVGNHSREPAGQGLDSTPDIEVFANGSGSDDLLPKVSQLTLGRDRYRLGGYRNHSGSSSWFERSNSWTLLDE